MQTCGNYDSDPCLEWNLNLVCNYGCDSLRKECKTCPDKDKDYVCDPFDLCPSTPNNTAVDINGCSHIQFCGLQPVCGAGCDLADWRNDSELSKPYDCRSVVVEKEGKFNARCVAIELTCS